MAEQPHDNLPRGGATTLGTNLKRARGRRPQTAIAEASGLTQSAISRYENDEDVPELKSLLKLAIGLGAPVDALINGLDPSYDALYPPAGSEIRHGTYSFEGNESTKNAASVSNRAQPEAAQRLIYGLSPSQVAATHSAIARAITELATIAEQLPRGQAAVARAEPPADAPRHRKRGRQPNRRSNKKTPTRR